MIAYNKTWLYNLGVRQQVAEALENKTVSADEQAAVFQKYTTGFYTPNIFMRVGLFALAVIILLFSLGLLALIVLMGNESAFSGLSLFFSFLCFAVLEFFISTKHHYQSGIDDALLWAGSACLIGGIVNLIDPGATLVYTVVFIISILCTIRYANPLMASVAFVSLLAIVFYSFKDIGSIGISMLPFILMGISLLTYQVTHKKMADEKFNEYSPALRWVKIVSLCSLYAAGNYFVVSETIGGFYRSGNNQVHNVYFETFFWVYAILMPLIYLWLGVKNKDAVLLRVGLLLIAAAVFTFRYYHFIMPVETVMCLAGIALLVISWITARYLQTAKHGITSLEIKNKNVMGKMQIESLIIAESFAQQNTGTSGNRFGGGDFGGGGATGNF